jgi:hypothetical protein
MGFVTTGQLDVQGNQEIAAADSMGKICFLSREKGHAWGTRDRALFGVRERALLTGPGAKEAETWAYQPICDVASQVGKPGYVNLFSRTGVPW